jgi:hypothetical protein
VGDHSKFMRALIAPAPAGSWWHGAFAQGRVESRVQPAVFDELRSGAHDFVVRPQYSAMMGWGQAVLPHAKTSGSFGASDPRAEGAAEPEPISTRIAVQQQSRP